MRSVRTLAVAAAVTLATVCSLRAQQAQPVPSQPYEWKNVQIVGGGFVSGIVFHPKAKGVAYARTDMGGGYRLDPATHKWIPITDFFKNYGESGIESIAVDPQNSDRVYFMQGTATADWAPKGKLLRSDNRGETWEKIDLPFKLGANDNGRSIGERLAVDPVDGNILFMGTRLNGLWQSIDRGSTWQQVESFPQQKTEGNIGVGVVIFDHRSSFGGKTGTIYATISRQGTPIYRSTDGGATWSPVTGQPGGLIPHHMALVDDGTLYVTYGDQPGPNGMGNGAVWKMDTASGAWTDITPKKPRADGEPGYGYAGLGVDVSNPKVLVVSTMDRWNGGDQLWRSTDSGVTWKELGKVSQRDDSVAPYFGNGVGHWIGDYKIDPFAPGHQLYVTGAGIWGTDEGDAVDSGKPIHWIARAQGLEECAIQDLIYPPGGVLLSGMSDLGGFRHDDPTISPRAGTYSSPKTSQVTRLDFAALKPQEVVRINSKGWDGKGALGAVSSDGGVTWQAFASTPQGAKGHGNGLAMAADGASIVWIPQGAAAHVSMDRGATWKPCAGLGGDARWVAADRADAKTIYGIDEKTHTLYTSADGGRATASSRQRRGWPRRGIGPESTMGFAPPSPPAARSTNSHMKHGISGAHRANRGRWREPLRADG